MDFAAHVDCVSASAIDLSIGFDEQMELCNMLPNDLDLVCVDTNALVPELKHVPNN